jgi:hypothetical protein
VLFYEQTFKNIQKRSKTYKNCIQIIQKQHRNIQKLYGNIQEFQTFYNW